MTRQELKNQAKDIMRNNGLFIMFIAALLVVLVTIAANFFAILVAGPAIVGLAYFNLQSFRNRKSSLEDLVKPGSKNYLTTLITPIVKGVFIFLWTLLLIVPGIIKSFAYAMTEYIIADNPEIGITDAMRESQEMMRGHKTRYFVLQLSFIGWGLLVIPTFGLILIYLIPYKNATEAAFYLDLINDKSLDSNYSDEYAIDEDDYIIEFD